MNSSFAFILHENGMGKIGNLEKIVEQFGPYQHDFPYERGEEAHVTRREFCNFLALTSTALFVSAAGFAAKAALDARRVESFTPVKIEGAEGLLPGAALNFRYPGDDDTAILVRTREGEYRAYGQKCTHLACPVYYERERQSINRAEEAATPRGRRAQSGRTAVAQARLIMLVMINVAQLWILAATVEAALAGRHGEMLPLVVSSGVCWLISLSIILWWKPASRHHTSTGYIREQRRSVER